MPKKKKNIPQYETPANIRSLKAEISSMERMLEMDKKQKTPKIQDPHKFKEEITTKQTFLNKVTPSKFRKQKANKAYSKAKELKEIIQKAMPSERDFSRQYPKQSDGAMKQRDFDKAVQQQVVFQTNKRIQSATQEYKTLMRNIDPQDPNIANIENIRGANSLSFFLPETAKENYDKINWNKPIQTTLPGM